MILPVVLSLVVLHDGAGTFATESLAGREAYERADYFAAERHFLSALEASPAQNRQRAIALGNVASVLCARGRPRPALRHSQEAVAIWDALGREERESAVALHNLASIYRAVSEHGESERCERRALAQMTTLWGADDPRLAPVWLGLAGARLAQGDADDAERLFARAAATPGVLDEHRAMALSGQAQLLLDRQRLREAEPLLRQALALRERVFGPQHPFLGSAVNALGHLYLIRREPAAAIPYFQRSLALYARVDLAGVSLASVKNNLGQAYLLQGKAPAAMSLLREAVDLWSARLGPDHPNVASGLVNLAEGHAAQKQWNDAARCLLRALAIDEQRGGPGAAARDLARLAALSERRRQWAEAESFYRRALGAFQSSGLAPTPDQAGWLEAHARVLRSLADHAGAAKAETRAMTIRVKHALRESR